MLMYNKCIQQEIKTAQRKNKKNLVFLSGCHVQKGLERIRRGFLEADNLSID